MLPNHPHLACTAQLTFPTPLQCFPGCLTSNFCHFVLPNPINSLCTWNYVNISHNRIFNVTKTSVSCMVGILVELDPWNLIIGVL